MPPRHQGFGLFPGEVEHGRRADTADLQDVAESLRRDQAGLRAAFLQDRVGPDRRAVNHFAYIGQRRADVIQEVGESGDNRFARIVRRRRHLSHVERPVAHLGDDIRERAADIAADMYLDARHRRVLTI